MTKLQEAIENSGLSDSEIAPILKLSIPTISRWRAGKNAPLPLAVPGILDRLKKNTDICCKCYKYLGKQDNDMIPEGVYVICTKCAGLD